MKSHDRYRREKFEPRLDFIREFFSGCGDPRILDVGCGDGFFLDMAAKAFPTVGLCGVDIDEDVLRRAEYARGWPTLLCRDIYDARFFDEPQFFDVITCFDVLEHLYMPQAFFRHARTLLSSDGIVILSVPNVQLGYRMRSVPHLGIPDTDKTHVYLASPEGWRTLISNEGFCIIDEWYGEHLTHIKALPRMAQWVCDKLRVDPRRVPLLNQFEQSYIMVIVPK